MGARVWVERKRQTSSEEKLSLLEDAWQRVEKKRGQRWENGRDCLAFEEARNGVLPEVSDTR